MKLCLVYPGNLFLGEKLVMIPFNQQLFYLFSYLRQHAPQVEVEILDLEREISSLHEMPVELFLREAEALLKQTGFDMVGISCWTTYNFPSTVEIARLCKQLNPECTVIVGGYHPTTVPGDFCYPDSPFDYVVQGEGEQALLDIVTGKISREQSTQVVAGTPLPMDAHRLRWGECKYHTTMEVMPIWLSRGCPFACSFCADRLTNYRILSPQASLAELQRLLAHNPQVDLIMLCDPLFGLRKDWRREFLTLLQQADLPVRFWAETRVDLLEKEDIDLLAPVSAFIDLGLESVVPEMLTIMKKASHPQRYLERCFELDDYMNRKEIPHAFNQIFNHPGETRRTLKQAQNFWQGYFQQVDRTRGGRCYTYVLPVSFLFLPGSDVFFHWDDYVQKYGCSVANPTWWKQSGYPLSLEHDYVLGSRELAEEASLDLVPLLANQLIGLVMAHLHMDIPRLKLFDHDWVKTFKSRRIVQGSRYFHDKPLRLHPRAVLYPRDEDNTAVLFHWANRQCRELSTTGRELLQNLLAGRTVAELGQEQPADLHDFISDLVGAGFLVVKYPPPPKQPEIPGPVRVRVQTSRGPIELELDPDRAPRLAANFLYLAGRHFYDGLRVELAQPSTWVEAGVLKPFHDGVGYTLPAENTGMPLDRGVVAMARDGLNLHGSCFRLYRREADPADASCAFGRVVNGWETLDALIVGDYITRVQVL